MSLQLRSRRISGTIALVLFAFAAVTATGKPKGGGGGSQDIPICVTVSDDMTNVTSDGQGVYCDSTQAKIDAFVGRQAGQFYLETNTNLSGSGRSMVFYFPAGTTTEVFGDIGVDTYPLGFVPTNVWVLSARSSVGEENGYVDLRTMTPGQSKPIAIRIQLEHNRQNKINLHYGDVLWADSTHQGGQLAIVVGGPDLDDDGFSDGWTISGGTAWNSEIGEVDMGFVFTFEK